jgi:hypothetical protein
MRKALGVLAVLSAAALALTLAGASSAGSGGTTYDLNTLAGKVAALKGTASLQIRFSAFIEQEAEEADDVPAATTPITPTHVLSSPLDATSVAGTVNLDTAAAPQNETAIAVDPNNSSRVVAAANDYATRAWSCFIGGTPCSALGDGYSGTYFSTNGGASWCCNSSDPSHIGTLIPGVEHLVGGQYDAGGDPALAFDSRGNVYYAGLGFNRTSAPNTVAVNKGTFGRGGLTWSAPTFINQTTSPSVLNDKEWIAVDSHRTSPFRDRIYVTWTRFLFNASNGAYTQSPIMFASSSDGGATFTDPKLISGNVLYGQGSRPVVGPDGTLYAVWVGSTRQQSLDSEWVVKSTDGGATWSKPTAVSTVADSLPLRDTLFRVNSYPAAAAAPNGDLYVTWDGEVPNDGSTYAGTNGCAYWLSGTTAVRNACHSAALFSKSTDGGATWTAPAPVFTQTSRVAVGYPATNPDGSTLNAPSAKPVEDIFPAAAASANGKVYLGAYRGTTVSPWQTCKEGPAPPEGRINCTTLGKYIDNTRLSYVVRDVTTNVTRTVSPELINTQYGFGGGFFGDYTDLTADASGTFHAHWTDSNNVQNVVWFYGLQFVPTPIHQEDVVTGSGNY